MIAFAFATLAAALFATYVAGVWRWVDCNVGSPECEPASLWQVYAAAAGIPVAAAMVVDSLRARGRPLLWFLLATAVYGAWGALAYYALHVK